MSEPQRRALLLSKDSKAVAKMKALHLVLQAVNHVRGSMFDERDHGLVLSEEFRYLQNFMSPEVLLHLTAGKPRVVGEYAGAIGVVIIPGTNEVMAATQEVVGLWLKDILTMNEDEVGRALDVLRTHVPTMIKSRDGRHKVNRLINELGQILHGE